MNVKAYFLNIWKLIDPIYFMFTRLTYIEQASTKNIFRVRLTRYKGKNVILSDGTCIQKNDLLLKIHLHNVVLLNELLPNMNELTKSRKIYEVVENSLPGLAEYILNHSKFQQIKGIIGITMLNRGSKTLGFEAIPISNQCYKIYKCLALLPIYFLSVSNPLKMLKKHTPIYLFMSKALLLQKYGA